jgi:hypothetical protein
MKPNMKIKIVLLCGLFGFVAMLLVMNTTGKPSLGTNPYQSGCHSSTGYYITANTTSVKVDPGKSFTIMIDASGTPVEVQAYPGARNNNNFNFQPSATITDGSPADLNTILNAISVKLTITAPAQSGTYKIMIIARDSSTTLHPNFAYVEITVTVGSGGGSGGSSLDIGAFFTDHVFNHLDFYIGGAAVVSLALATILYKVDKQRFTKIHGYLSLLAFGLTTINVIMIFSIAGSTLLGYIADPASISWLHLIHMIVGITGYSFGIIAVLTGLGGIRTCKPGYVALFCWALNLLLGIMPPPIGWGLNL